MSVAKSKKEDELRPEFPQSRRSLSGRLSLLIVGLLLGVLVCELAIRVTGMDFPLVTYVHDNTVPLRKAYGSVRCVNDIVRVYRLNNFGFHDLDWTNTKGTGKRVLFMGDSMLECAQVPQASGFSQLVEDRLNQAGGSIDILNAGVTGTGTADQYLLWTEYLRNEIEISHLVLFFFLGNDLQNNHRHLGHPPVRFGAYLDAEGSVTVNRIPQHWAKAGIQRVCEYSAAGAFVYRSLYRLRRMRAHAEKERKQVGTLEVGGPQSEASVDYLSESIAGTLKLLLTWAEETKQEGVGFSVVLLGNPEGEQLSSFVESLRSGLGEGASKRVLSVRVVEEDLVKFQSFDGVTIGHYNRAGHAWVANQIAGWLQEVIE